MNIVERITADLFEMQDLQYRDFHSKLMPTVDKDKIIGVRVPQLRKYAKEIAKDENISEFLTAVPHEYYEENNLHAFIVESIKDFKACIKHLEAFLPYIDNWATCDMLRPKCFKNNTEKLYEYVLKWIKSEKPYIVRYALGMLNSYYMDEYFEEKHLLLAASVKHEDYYVRMMVAWYFATALSKQYSSALPYIKKRKLFPWVHNKTIQKAIESYRISPEQKEYLKTLRI